jgi:hypothetical protein
MRSTEGETDFQARQRVLQTRGVGEHAFRRRLHGGQADAHARVLQTGIIVSIRVPDVPKEET